MKKKKIGITFLLIGIVIGICQPLIKFEVKATEKNSNQVEETKRLDGEMFQEAKAQKGVGNTIAEHFIDPAMAQAVANQVSAGNVNTVITQDVIDNTTYLRASGMSIVDVTGINIFVNLQELYLEYNLISDIDVSKLSKLQHLELSKNLLTSFDGSGLAELQILNIHSNKLTHINLSKMFSLRELSLYQNLITNISLTDLTNLISLNLSSNKLISIDLSTVNKLDGLTLFNNDLMTLDVSNLTNLTYFNVARNYLTNIDVSELSKMIYLNISNNQLETFDGRGLTDLKTLIISQNNLKTVDVSGLVYLDEIMAENNQLTKINLDGLIELKHLYAPNNMLTSINLTGLDNLQFLELFNNQLTSLPNSILDLPQIWHLTLSDNLLPTDYQNKIKNSSLSSSFGYEVQDQLQLTATTYLITEASDFTAIDLHAIVKLASGKHVSLSHDLIFENYVDENEQLVDINNYIQNGHVIESGTVYAQVRSTGTGIFPNTSNHALTQEKVQFNFIKKARYKTIFDLNGGVGTTPSIQSLYEGSLVVRPSINPVREGYTFINWNTQIDGNGVNWNFDTDVITNKDVTLYAQWKNVTSSPILPKTGNDTSRIGLIILLMGSALMGARRRNKKL